MSRRWRKFREVVFTFGRRTDAPVEEGVIGVDLAAPGGDRVGAILSCHDPVTGISRLEEFDRRDHDADSIRFLNCRCYPVPESAAAQGITNRIHAARLADVLNGAVTLDAAGRGIGAAFAGLSDPTRAAAEACEELARAIAMIPGPKPPLWLRIADFPGEALEFVVAAASDLVDWISGSEVQVHSFPSSFDVAFHPRENVASVVLPGAPGREVRIPMEPADTLEGRVRALAPQDFDRGKLMDSFGPPGENDSNSFGALLWALHESRYGIGPSVGFSIGMSPGVQDQIATSVQSTLTIEEVHRRLREVIPRLRQVPGELEPRPNALGPPVDFLPPSRPGRADPGGPECLVRAASNTGPVRNCSLCGVLYSTDVHGCPTEDESPFCPECRPDRGRVESEGPA